MTYTYPPSMEGLIDALGRLPGVGTKTATRLAVFLLNSNDDVAANLANAIELAKTSVRHCNVCGNLTDEDVCSVCSDVKRNQKILCVVEQTGDSIVIEKTGEFNGLYHILHGALSPMEGIGPDDINIKPLLSRLEDSEIEEIIMATSTGVNGEATALYLARLLKNSGIKITRIAYGVPVGGDLEYTDQLTLGRAITGRSIL